MPWSLVASTAGAPMRAELEASTVTPTRTALELSRTIPRMPPVDTCASATAAIARVRQTRKRLRIREPVAHFMWGTPQCPRLRLRRVCFGEQFLNGPVCLVDGDVGVRRGAGIRVRDRDAAKRLAPDF